MNSRLAGRPVMAAAIALAALTAIRLVVSAYVPLSPDEAYYWVWSRALAPSYLDHSPMVALWVRAGTWIAGDSAFGIRLLGPLSAALGSVLLVQAAEDLLPEARAGIKAAVLLNATLVLGVGAVIMTPDTPLLFFWTATLWALGRLVRSGNGAWWLVAGAMAGLAMASKYTAALLIAAVFVWSLLLPQTRAWLRRPHPWAAALIAALIFAPVIWWNAAHGWASFVKQGGRTGDWQPSRALTFLGELIGGQFGLATPLIFLLCIGGVWVVTRRALQRHDPGAALLVVVTLLPTAVFVQHAFGDRVQGNWPAVIYPSACIAAAALCSRWWRPAAALGFVMTLLVYAHGATGLPHLPPRIDPSARLLAGWPGLADRVDRVLTQAGGSFVAADDYGTAALLARDLPRSVPVIGAEPRWRFFNLQPASAAIGGHTGILVRSARRHDPPDPHPWAEIAPIGMAGRRSGSMVAEDYVLYRVTSRPDADATVLLPHREN